MCQVLTWVPASSLVDPLLTSRMNCTQINICIHSNSGSRVSCHSSRPPVVFPKYTAQTQSPNPSCLASRPQWHESEPAAILFCLHGRAWLRGRLNLGSSQACRVPRTGLAGTAGCGRERPPILALKCHALYRTTAFGGRMAWSEGTCREYSVTSAGAFFSIS